MRTSLLAASAMAFVAAVGLAPAADAATKYEFHDVMLSEDVTGVVQASVQVMNKKPDHVYCYYATPEWQPLGYYQAFVEPAPSTADGVLAFCKNHFEDRWQ